MYTLIVILWLSPALGYTVTGETGLTLSECREAAFYATGESRCVRET